MQTVNVRGRPTASHNMEEECSEEEIIYKAAHFLHFISWSTRTSFLSFSEKREICHWIVEATRLFISHLWQKDRKITSSSHFIWCRRVAVNKWRYLSVVLWNTAGSWNKSGQNLACSTELCVQSVTHGFNSAAEIRTDKSCKNVFINSCGFCVNTWVLLLLTAADFSLLLRVGRQTSVNH